MEMFVDEPELLGGSQTFIGVLITLLVLCLFHDKNTNFMLKIVINMIEDFMSSIAHSVDRMREDLKKPSSKSKSEQLAFADYHWIKQSEAYPDIHKKLLSLSEETESIIIRFVNSHQRHLERLSIIQEKVDKKNENELVSHSMLLILMIIMTVDAVGMSKGFGSVFLSFLILFYSLFYIYLWVQYLNFKTPQTVKYTTTRTVTLFSWSIAILILSFSAWFLLSITTSLDFYSYLLCSALIFALPITIIGVCVSRNFRHSERYNKKFVTNHTLYIMLTSLVFSICVYFITNKGLPFGLQDNKELMSRWFRYIGFFNDHVYGVRSLMVCFAAFNAFFIPIFAVYIYCQVSSICIKVQMCRTKDKARKKLEELRSDYVDLLHQMLETEKNGTAECRS